MFDHGNEAHEAALARRHFLGHHARVAAAEEKNQAALRDAVGAQLGRRLNVFHFFGFEAGEQGEGAVEVGFSGIRGHVLWDLR